MAVFEHFGSNVCGIRELPWTDDYCGASSEQVKAFLKKVKGLKYQHLFAITTIYQKKVGTNLEKEGFKAVVKFKSAHYTPKEILTLWVKTQKKFQDLTNEKVHIPIDCNCSVGFTRTNERDKNKNCVLIVKGKKEVIKNLKEAGFERVGRTPIFYKIRKGKLRK